MKIRPISLSFIRKLFHDLETQIYAIFIFLSFHFVLFHFTKDNLSIQKPFLLLVSLLPLFLWFRLRNVSTPKSNYRLLFKMVFFLILIVTIFNGIIVEKLGVTVASIGIYSQIIIAYYFSRIELSFLIKVFKTLAILAILFLPYIYLNQNIELEAALNRDTVEGELFFYAGAFWAVVPFVIASFLSNKNILLSLIYWIAAIFLNLMFLKRFIIIDSLLLLIMIVLIYKINGRRIVNSTSLVLVFMFSIGVYFLVNNNQLSALYKATFDRMEETSHNFNQFDRFEETRKYFEKTNPFLFILGKGLNGTREDNYGREMLALHVGWTNFLLKGGVLLLLLILAPYFKLLKIFPQIKRSPLRVKFSACFLLIQLVRLSYQSMHSNSPEILIFFYSIFVIMDYNFSTSKKRISS